MKRVGRFAIFAILSIAFLSRANLLATPAAPDESRESENTSGQPFYNKERCHRVIVRITDSIVSIPERMTWKGFLGARQREKGKIELTRAQHALLVSLRSLLNDNEINALTSYFKLNEWPKAIEVKKREPMPRWKKWTVASIATAAISGAAAFTYWDTLFPPRSDIPTAIAAQVEPMKRKIPGLRRIIFPAEMTADEQAHVVGVWKHLETLVSEGKMARGLNLSTIIFDRESDDGYVDSSRDTLQIGKETNLARLEQLLSFQVASETELYTRAGRDGLYVSKLQEDIRLVLPGLKSLKVIDFDAFNLEERKDLERTAQFLRQLYMKKALASPRDCSAIEIRRGDACTVQSGSADSTTQPATVIIGLKASKKDVMIALSSDPLQEPLILDMDLVEHEKAP